RPRHPSWNGRQPCRGPSLVGHGACERPGGSRRCGRRSPSWRRARRCRWSGLSQCFLRGSRGRWHSGHRLARIAMLRCCGCGFFDLFLFLLWSLLFSAAKKAVDHTAEIATDQPLHQICARSTNSAPNLEADGRITRFIDGLEILANRFEELATNSIVDSKLGIEFQLAIERDCAGRSQANIWRTQNQFVDRYQARAQMIFCFGLLQMKL